VRTIQISNGDIFVAKNTGRPALVEGLAKNGQDMARHILQEYSSFFDEGSDLETLTFNDEAGNAFSEAVVYQYIYDAVTRLISIQRNAGQDQQILKINEIKVRRVNNTDVVFYVEVMADTGSPVVLVQRVTGTQLNQLLDPNVYLKN